MVYRSSKEEEEEVELINKNPKRFGDPEKKLVDFSSAKSGFGLLNSSKREIKDPERDDDEKKNKKKTEHTTADAALVCCFHGVGYSERRGVEWGAVGGGKKGVGGRDGTAHAQKEYCWLAR